MKVSARGWWLEDAGPVAACAPLEGDVTADVVVLGGGYTGMWAAWHLLERGARVVLLESGVCGEGPSGRNGGFVDHLAHAAPRLRELFGDAAARATIQESLASVRNIGAAAVGYGDGSGDAETAVLVVSTDQPVSQDLLDAILALEGFLDGRTVSLV